jgi:outer membrane autotransporter protein
MSLKPVISVAYGHDFDVRNGLTAALATLPAALFQVSGAPLARNFAETKLGVELAFAPGAALFASFDGDFSGREQIYGGKGGLKIMW